MSSVGDDFSYPVILGVTAVKLFGKFAYAGTYTQSKPVFTRKLGIQAQTRSIDLDVGL